VTTAGQLAMTRTKVQSCCILAAMTFVACSKKAHPGQTTGGSIAATSSASLSSSASPPRLGCKARGTSFSVGPLDGAAATDSDGDIAADAPFGVTIGSAVGHAGGYVVTAIDAREGSSHAVVALLDSEIAGGTILDLGRVYGDAEPPRVVVRNESAFVVVPDSDASGNTYRYAWVRGLDRGARIDWLGAFEQGVDESAVVALACTEATITVAWDEVDRATHQGRIRWASLDGNGLPITAGEAAKSARSRTGTPGFPINATAPELDAEAPQLVAHRAGYWLAFLVRESQTARATGTTAGIRPSARHRQATDDQSASNDEVRAVELGRRGIALLPLDPNGRVNGKAIAVTERTAHVVTFDIEATDDGGAVVAYRDADAIPGVEAQVIEIARVRPDGGVERHRIDDERIGAGTPVLLVDTQAGAARPRRPSIWLAVAGSAGETRLAELPEQGAPLLDLVEEPNLIGVEPMLRLGDSLLVSRHHARSVEFERLDCAWSEGKAAAPRGP
jgi:hypothetical protein